MALEKTGISALRKAISVSYKNQSIIFSLLSVCLSLSCECEKRTNIASDIGIEAAKHHVAVGKLLRAALPHDHLGHVANGRGLLPPHGILVLLACGAGRGADCVQLEGRVALQQEDEALADGAGAAEDAWEYIMLERRLKRGIWDCGKCSRTALLARGLRCHCGWFAVVVV